LRIRILIAILVVAVLLFGCVTKAGNTVVFQGTSMLPAIHDGEILSVKKFSSEGEIDVRRGDIIQFLYPQDTSKFYIKRLIALPNETVEIHEGKVIVDGKELAEPYVDPKRNMAKSSEPPIKVGEDAYYVLGDNRDASSDSRSWGLVPKKNILAKILDK
jgi:signal peptidase I